MSKLGQVSVEQVLRYEQVRHRDRDATFETPHTRLDPSGRLRVYALHELTSPYDADANHAIRLLCGNNAPASPIDDVRVWRRTMVFDSDAEEEPGTFKMEDASRVPPPTIRLYPTHVKEKDIDDDAPMQSIHVETNGQSMVTGNDAGRVERWFVGDEKSPAVLLHDAKSPIVCVKTQSDDDTYLFATQDRVFRGDSVQVEEVWRLSTTDGGVQIRDVDAFDLTHICIALSADVEERDSKQDRGVRKQFWTGRADAVAVAPQKRKQRMLVRTDGELTCRNTKYDATFVWKRAGDAVRGHDWILAGSIKLVVAWESGLLQVWDAIVATDSFFLMHDIRMVSSGVPAYVAASTRRRGMVAIVDDVDTLHVWEMENKTQPDRIFHFPHVGHAVASVQWVKDTDTVVTVGDSGRWRSIDVCTGMTRVSAVRRPTYMESNRAFASLMRGRALFVSSTMGHEYRETIHLSTALRAMSERMQATQIDVSDIIATAPSRTAHVIRAPDGREFVCYVPHSMTLHPPTAENDRRRVSHDTVRHVHAAHAILERAMAEYDGSEERRVTSALNTSAYEHYDDMDPVYAAIRDAFAYMDAIASTERNILRDRNPW